MLDAIGFRQQFKANFDLDRLSEVIKTFGHRCRCQQQIAKLPTRFEGRADILPLAEQPDVPLYSAIGRWPEKFSVFTKEPHASLKAPIYCLRIIRPEPQVAARGDLSPQILLGRKGEFTFDNSRRLELSDAPIESV